ncbi:MAG: hypothetical protein ACYDBJ_25905 [Aggregatilineales bacterium]
MIDYDRAQALTALHLRQAIERETSDTSEYTHVTLPEQKALIEEIARLIPSGNVASLVTAGLIRAPGRIVAESDNRRNLTLLLQGMQTFLDKAAYQAFFVGPSAVLSAYQLMLKLAGKDPDQSFPDGTWQFYVEFGLREDSGRHTCETTGFHDAMARESWKLESGDELACWIAAASWLLAHYEDLLACDWDEHIRLRQYAEQTKDEHVRADWIKRRPYRVPEGVTELDYIGYRRAQFAAFYESALSKLPARTSHKLVELWQVPELTEQRVAYQRQMSIAAILMPTEYSDVRQPIAPNELALGVIRDGRYYVFSALKDSAPLTVAEARRYASAMVRGKPTTPTAELDKWLSVVRRRDQPDLRRQLSDETHMELEALRRAPIMLNWDRADANVPLSVLRRTERRGVGDHPLTIFRTGQSAVFDLSHIFFDGIWGTAVAEILTGLATRLARDWVKQATSDVPQPRSQSRPTLPRLSALVRPLTLAADADLIAAAKAARLPPEVSAETDAIQLEPIVQLRRTLQKRNADLRLSVNDLLILYRSIFGQCYVPAPDVLVALATLEASADAKARTSGALARAAIEVAQQANPSLLIPMDAASMNPRERVYPTTFRNQYPQVLTQHRHALEMLDIYLATPGLRRGAARRAFEQARNDYFSTLSKFSALMTQYKDVTMHGGSVSTATIRRLAGLPNSVRRMLDGLPERFDAVNEIIKGQEVFSNVGRVNAESSLRRFTTAKDDNEKKTLAWGIITDAAGVVHVSLRDFRPHVTALLRIGKEGLAQAMTQDYVNAYAHGLNQFIAEALRIAQTRGDGTGIS